MKFEQDYIMRMIKEMVHALAEILFNKSESSEDESAEEKQTGELLKMADQGRINDAENILLSEDDKTSPDYLKRALTFYEHVNDYTEDYLEEHNYSREEIADGLRSLLAGCGMDGLMDLIIK
ncbi:DUF6483 family protein [Ruminococcus sp. OA3]|uniref:DUF6483 family protein n=1 Tax=Ruminococcus sp. OA3 TaxID=2914164 RepID=UPI001F05FFFB|nr:DUF6483 family protein [Ruminococcus sp. OA3]MCH1981817.1 DUF6483 family protein [Ruminococcus sp. OA3]